MRIAISPVMAGPRDSVRFEHWRIILASLGHTVTTTGPVDLYIAMANAITGALPTCPIVAVQPIEGGGVLDGAWRDANLIVGTAHDSLPEWRDRRPMIAALGDRWLPAHFPVSPQVARLLTQDGLLRAYLADDLYTIRARYIERKRYDVGFCGDMDASRGTLPKSIPLRRQVAAGFRRPRWDFRAGRLNPEQYLRYLMRCRLTVPLPGDRVKSYRHTEAAMMGSPLCLVPEDTPAWPPHSPSNTVCMRHWTDDKTIAGVLRSRTGYHALARASDDAYRNGWSQRGLVVEMLRRATG